MRYTHAITRKPGADFAAGLTLSPPAVEPQLDTLLKQHARYEALLRELGLQVVSLPALPEFPDAYFVEDVAVVLNGVAVVTRPGAASRRGETTHVQAVLSEHRDLAHIESPGKLDGGDALLLGRNVCIGLSRRTNTPGAEQLAAIVRRHGYRCTPMEVGAGLHLKSGVTQVSEDTLLLTEQFAHHPAFANYRRITLPAAQSAATNALWINGRVVVSCGSSEVTAPLAAAGIRATVLDISEARKMDGGLTCLSLLL